MDEKVAVWDGRFQPLHKGHIGVIEAIVKQFKCDLFIMIIRPSEGSIDQYGEEVNRHHLLSRNPLTFWECFNLMKLAIKPLEYASRINILGIPRPDLHWEIARGFYPDKRFICLTSKDQYEKQKEEFWAELGEETRIIDTSGIPKTAATDFKIAVKNNQDWEQYIPEEAIEYFKKINGFERFKQADL